MDVNRTRRIRTASFYAVTFLLLMLVGGLVATLAVLTQAVDAVDADTRPLIARAAWFTLVLLGVAVILLIWEILRFIRHRMGFRGREAGGYVDAWSEAGRRIQTDEEGEQP